MPDRKARPRWARWHGQQAVSSVTHDPNSALEVKVSGEVAEEQQRAFLAKVTGWDRRPWQHRS